MPAPRPARCGRRLRARFRAPTARPGFERNLDRFRQKHADQGRCRLRLSGALRFFDGGQFGSGVTAHLLFEPDPDFGGMEAPHAVHAASRNASAADKLFELAPIAAKLYRQFVKRQELVGHRAPRVRRQI